MSKERRDVERGQPRRREFQVHHRAVNKEARTVEVAFSSEEPVERWGWVEILDHAPESVRLGRLSNGAAMLFNHHRDQHLGTVESAGIAADRVGRAVIRFGRGPLAEEKFQDVQDNILTKVSVQYLPHREVREESSDEGPDIYRVVDWEPLEISFVTIPADDSVGLGRAFKENTMKTQNAVEVTHENPESGTNQERARVLEILAIGQQHAMEVMAREAVTEGWPLNRFQQAVLEKRASQSRSPNIPGPGSQPVATLGTTFGLRENQYSVSRALHAAAFNDWSDAGLEREVHQELSKGKKLRGNIVIPWFKVPAARDWNVGTGSEGGYLVGTEHRPELYIDALRNQARVIEAGATLLDNLVGDQSLPKMTGTGTAEWLAEGGAASESSHTFSAVPLTPKTVSAWATLTRRLIKQGTPQGEHLLRQDLMAVVANAIDLAALHGTGASNQPTGIAATSGIGSVAGGTNGLAPAWSHIVDLETEVSVDNAAAGNLAYLTNSKVRGKLKKTDKGTDTGAFVWSDGDRPVNGTRALVSNQSSSALTKGTAEDVCSAIFYGNWADLLIGRWGALDVLVDPYTEGTAGNVRVIVHADVDIAVRHAESFAAMLDALTS